MNNSLTSFEVRANATMPYNSNFIFQTDTSFGVDESKGTRRRGRRGSNSPMLTLESHTLDTDNSIKIPSPKKRKPNRKEIKNMRDLRRSIQAKSSKKLLGSDSAQYLNDQDLEMNDQVVQNYWKNPLDSLDEEQARAILKPSNSTEILNKEFVLNKQRNPLDEPMVAAHMTYDSVKLPRNQNKWVRQGANLTQATS